ncbi:MAG: hypothetical protein HYX76_08630 [Acidobacteria bacterium]|nr:hypothetical protein [Acidobacteriota bacterium]
MRTRPASDRGQAITETMLLTWILVLLIAMAWQLFIVNDTVFRSVTAVHADLFRQGYQANKSSKTYNSDSNAKVIWNTTDIPEIEIPVIGMFRGVLPSSIRIRSNVRGPEPAKGCPVPCKKSKMAAGTDMNVFTAFGKALLALPLIPTTLIQRGGF